MSTNYFDLHGMLEDTEPIALPRPLLIKRFAARFRNAATQWRDQRREFSQATPWEVRVTEMKLRTTCGELIVEAYKAGVLPHVGGMHDIVAWHTAGDSDDPRDVHARFVRCPANLFVNIAGGNLAHVFNDGGNVRIIGEPFGGIAPRLRR